MLPADLRDELPARADRVPIVSTLKIEVRALDDGSDLRPGEASRT